MLCILYFITVPGVYKLNKVLHAAACFPVCDKQKGPDAVPVVTQTTALGAPLYAGQQQVFVVSFQWAFLASEDHGRDSEGYSPCQSWVSTRFSPEDQNSFKNSKCLCEPGLVKFRLHH